MTQWASLTTLRPHAVFGSSARTVRACFLILGSLALSMLLGCDHNPGTHAAPTQPLSQETASPDTTCECGDTITHSIVLTGDLLDCPGDGLLIVYHGPDSLVVDGAGHRIDGLGTPGSAGLRLDTTVGVRVRNCVITDFESGIRSHGGKGDIISNSELSRGEYGFWGTGSKGNQFIGNSIHDNSRAGIELGFDATNNVILRNDLSKNGYGIYAYGFSSGTTISQNTIRNSSYGIVIYSGSSYSLIEDNTITDNRRGIVLESSTRQTEYGIVRNNTLQGNTEGITLKSSGRNTIESNTLLQSHVGILLTDDDWGSPECQQNTIQGNLVQGATTGISLNFATGNSVTGNTILDYRSAAVWPGSCGNEIKGNLGNQGLAIAYLTGSATLRDTTLSEVLVCNGQGVTLEDVLIPAPGGCGLVLLDSHSINLSRVRVLNRTRAANIQGCSDVRIEDCTFTENEFGMIFTSTTNSVITGSEFRGGANPEITLVGSSYNWIWNNIFEGTAYYLAEEYEGSTGNVWNMGNTGNYWGDFGRNEGHPDGYLVPGPGDGVDHRPLNDDDGDGFPAWAECDDREPTTHPGAVERCNGMDDDCDGLVDECGCPPGEAARQAEMD